jgi:hypothetical protein
LLGILTGGLVLMAWKDPLFRDQLTKSHLSAASFALTGLLVVPLGSGFVSLLQAKHQDTTREQVTETIRRFLRNETITFGEVSGIPDSEAVALESVRIDWSRPNPEIRALVRVADPNLPTYTQVRAVQKEINKRHSTSFRLVVERTAVEIVGPPPPPPSPLPLLPQLSQPVRLPEINERKPELKDAAGASFEPNPDTNTPQNSTKDSSTQPSESTGAEENSTEHINRSTATTQRR